MTMQLLSGPRLPVRRNTIRSIFFEQGDSKMDAPKFREVSTMKNFTDELEIVKIFHGVAQKDGSMASWRGWPE